MRAKKKVAKKATRKADRAPPPSVHANAARRLAAEKSAASATGIASAGIASLPWKVVLTRLEGEFADEAVARAFFSRRSRSLAAGERLTILQT